MHASFIIRHDIIICIWYNYIVVGSQNESQIVLFRKHTYYLNVLIVPNDIIIVLRNARKIARSKGDASNFF